MDIQFKKLTIQTTKNSFPPPTPPFDKLSLPSSASIDGKFNFKEKLIKLSPPPSPPALSPPAMKNNSLLLGGEGYFQQQPKMKSIKRQNSYLSPASVLIIGTETRIQKEEEEEQQEPTTPISPTLKSKRKFYTVYKVVVSDEHSEWMVYKRYSEFDQLDRYHFPYIHKHLPQLPPKRFLLFDHLDPEFLQSRIKGLNHYMKRVFEAPVLKKSVGLRMFFQPQQQEPSQEVEKNYLKPAAVFETSESGSSTSGSPSPIKTSLKKTNSLRNRLKRVQWKRREFETNAQLFFPFKKTADPEPKPTSSTPEPVDDKKQYSPSLNDFYLLKLIGKGNFGKVLLAQHKETMECFAIKVISKQVIQQKNNKNDIMHIMTERQVLIRTTDHPFLISLKWAFQTPQKLYFVTDYVNGGELFFHLQKEKRFSELRAKFYAAEMTSALAHLHLVMDVVYRDLKPENVLLAADGHLKLTDFGLAKQKFLEQNNARCFTFCGTPEYLAPEVIRKEPYGFPVDWWCLGSVLFEMLVGVPPFYSQNAQEMFEKILNDKVKFPPYVSLRARSLICGLLNRSPHFRLGSGPENTSQPASIQNHPFFEGVDWERLVRKEYPPPFVPKVEHLYDLRNIDPQFVNEPLPSSILNDESWMDSSSDEDQQFFKSHQQPFKGFTYVGNEEWLQ